MGVKIDRTGSLARAQLVGVGKGVFEHFHHGNNTGRLVFDALNRRAGLAQVRQEKCHATAAF